MNIDFKNISDKVRHNIRLTDEDALFLYENVDLVSLGMLADEANRRKNGDLVFYNVNRHINPTNICAMSCKFCAYSRKPGEEGAYAYEIPEILEKAGQVVAQGATEVHMVGGLHPRWNFSKYTDILKALKENYPDLHIKAFTAVELDWMAKRDRRSVKEILSDLKLAGLGSLPGGGAEIFHPEIRDQICDTKTSADRWIEIHRTAHEMGLKSNCTMLYGHIESKFHRVDHMRRLRELQDMTGGFNAFIPLSFQPHDNQMGKDRYTFGEDDLRTLAIARLYLDNFKNIKSYWIMFGQDIAQLALSFGANDLDGTVTEEKISRMAGGRAGIVMSRLEIESLIRRANRIPQERDTLYNPVGVCSDRKTWVDPHMRSKLESLLFKYQHSQETHDKAELLQLANFAELDALAHASKILRSENSNTTSLGMQCVDVVQLDNWSEFDACIFEHNQDLIIDADNKDKNSSNALDSKRALKNLRLISEQNRDRNVGLKSLSSIYEWTKGDEVKTFEFFDELKKAGIYSWYQAPHRSSIGLTLQECLRMHKTAHEAGIFTRGSIEIPAAIQGSTVVFWEDYIQCLLEMNKFLSQSSVSKPSGKLLAVSIHSGKDSLISAHEYFRALSLARIILPKSVAVVSNLFEIPTLRQALKPGSSTKEQPVMKIAPLVWHYGSEVLGEINFKDLDQEFLLDEVKHSNISTKPVGIYFKTYKENLTKLSSQEPKATSNGMISAIAELST